VVILGAGTVGTHAARIALGMGAAVTVFDIDLERLRVIESTLSGRLTTVAASAPGIAREVEEADVVIGAVLVPGARAPVLVTEAMVRTMPAGAVIIDVAVDQGGCVETIRPTTQSDPVYHLHSVLHYGVANLPGAVPRSSTMALCNATLPYVLRLANHGLARAVETSPPFAAGVNTYRGTVAHPAVAQAQSLTYVPLSIEASCRGRVKAT
jgi:alanine dehydrogenase